MFYIAHRGNTHGIDNSQENNPNYIKLALDKGFDVEIDVWYENNKWFLGHDVPQYEIKYSYLHNNKFWCHAKNLAALELMLNDEQIHCFWHENDHLTLT